MLYNAAVLVVVVSVLELHSGMGYLLLSLFAKFNTRWQHQ